MGLVGMGALALLRIEGGFIIGGIEYDSSVSPYECGLGWAIDLGKGPFLGREALAADKERTDVRLGSVVLDSGGAAASGARLAVAGEDVGHVTPAVASPYLNGRTLRLAKLRRPSNADNTKGVATPRAADGASPGGVRPGKAVL